MNIILRLAVLCKSELLICSEKISSLHSLLCCCSLAQINFRIVRCFAVAHLLLATLPPKLSLHSFTRSLVSSNSGSMASLVISTFRRVRGAAGASATSSNSYNIAPVKAGTAPCVWERRRECWQQPCNLRK